mmetsp:Transcript_3385/g.4647  ORF Transcript_3385/g.4647 Transcript_3385/m.4647 type:complete len:399 (-) Transcript_3385:56-1252(-)
MDHKLLWVFLFVFIDVLGFSIILPLFPYYSERFSASPSIIGLILTSNALSQMLSTPIIGYLSDKYGRRPLLLLCILGTFVSFVLLALASSTTDLFFSRILDGLLGGNISLAQAYIADITDDSNRSKGLGLIGAAFGFGFIVGPIVGGSLTHFGYQAPAMAAAAVSLVNFIGVLLFLPESLPIEKRKSSHSFSSTESLTIVFRALQIPKLLPLLILRFTYGFTFTLFETCFGFFNIQRFSMSARHSSYLLAYVGIVFSLVQGGGIKMLTRRFSEQNLIVVSHVTLAISLLLWIGSFSIQHLLGALFPLSISLGLLHTLINSQITKQVKQSEMGETLGLSASVGSLTRILAPTLSGFLIDNFGLTSPAILACFLMIGMAAYAFQNFHNQSQTVSNKNKST